VRNLRARKPLITVVCSDEVIMRGIRIPAAMAIAFTAATALGENWPGWRGPRGDGSSAETGIPVKFGPDENLLWKAAIPGRGHSSPVIFGDRVFLTTCLETDGVRELLCLDRKDGKILWHKEIFRCPLEPKHKLNSFASSTPATDGKLVYVAFLEVPNMVVAAFDFEGNLAWKKSPGKFFSRHGFCTSPLIHKDLLILNGDQDPPDKKLFAKDAETFKGEAYIVALDKSTGEQKWRVNRPNITRSYCPPLIVEAAGKTQMILSGSKCVASYNPVDGKQWWIVDGPTEQFVSSAVFTDGVIFFTYGFPRRGIIGIRPDGEGNVTKTHVLWNIEKPSRGGYVPSPAGDGEFAFAVSDEGIGGCTQVKTGEQLWAERLGRHHSSSPVKADGNLYFVDDDGMVFVVKAGPKFELLAKNKLGEECFSSPAVSQGALYIRTGAHLWCFGKK